MKVCDCLILNASPLQVEAKALMGLLVFRSSLEVAKKVVSSNKSEGRGGGTFSSTPITKKSRVKKKPFSWELTVLGIDISIQSSDDDLVPRMLSSTAPMASQKLIDTLPTPFQFIIRQYPDVVSIDTAKRFIVGLESETKAFNALNKMVSYFLENNLKNALHQPQPLFHMAKDNYPHGLIGWSRKKDCLVEVECMGKWPKAYKQLSANGYTEDQMLKHLLFSYLYTFKHLDGRPWPNGKTVKIIDFEDLAMSHLNSQGFKFITKAGAALSVMFPQRMHQCFLLNAPGWWSMAWKLISPTIPEKVRQNMMLFGKNVSYTSLTFDYYWCALR